MNKPAHPVTTLNTGRTIPQVGLGVYQSPRGEGTQAAVRDALELGYRHIDTARIYGNEKDVGIAVRDSGVPREEIFVISKLWNDDQGYESALKAFDASLGRLGFDYLDLFLLHWPVPGKRLDSWRALEKLHADGKVRAIGISNFMASHIEELMGKAKVTPAIDQIEMTPFLQQREARAACKQHGIAVEAYSPLTRGEKLDHPVVVSVARSAQRTPAQVLLRWGIQSDAIVLPKSTQRARIEENAAIFDFQLTDAEMKKLDSLEEGLVTGWDPRTQK
jgi:diketogulonate reductase-like aldo/keto reductase